MLNIPGQLAIELRMHSAIAAAHKQAAKEMLEAIRAALSTVNLSRHVISISAGMGACSILINGKVPNRHNMLILAELEDSLDWDWCEYLDGQIVNNPNPDILQQWKAAEKAGIPANKRME